MQPTDPTVRSAVDDFPTLPPSTACEMEYAKLCCTRCTRAKQNAKRVADIMQLFIFMLSIDQE
ncbi:hypothetical protein T06_15713 [Trichinella sp. T6]|nr:hypothetical protein T06_15713 [Trichinella sp. T6]